MCIFKQRPDISRRSAWKFQWRYRALSRTWISPVLVAISLESPIGAGARWFFGQFVLDIASVTCVTYNCPRGRRRRRLTCDKLSQSSKWWSGVNIRQWSTRYSSRIASFSFYATANCCAMLYHHKMSVRLSVRLSVRHISSNFFHHGVATPS